MVSPTHSDSEHLRKIISKLFPAIRPALVETISSKMKWQKLNAGETLFQQGDLGDSFYVLLSGRLKALVKEGSSAEHEVGEILKGESVGEMSLITGEKRTATIRAVRDSFVASLDRQGFQELMAADPQVLMEISKQIIQRLTNSIQRSPPRKSYSSVAIFPLGRVSGSSFTNDLLQVTLAHSQVKLIDKAGIAADLPSASAGDVQLTNWLSEMEAEYELILYQCDPADPDWSGRCLRQADKILIITHVDDEPEPSPDERALIKQLAAGDCELVILHPAETTYPQNTQKFLSSRKVHRHYHLREGKQEDFARLGRIVAGKANALVLAGGGAKGFAHIGIFRALQEKQIPIDIVAGTSIGSIMAAGIAMGWSPDTVQAKCRQAFLNDKPLKDYTLPMVSFLKGRRFQSVIRKYFQDINIEDLWINFFCISANFSSSEPVVHQSGPLYKALAASASIPGILPPVVEGNQLLIDGGVFNNFPVDVMRQLYDCHIIGVDLNAEKEYELNYLEVPDGWRYLLGNVLSLGRRYRLPGIATIMMKATILGSRQKQAEMQSEVDLYLKPPVERFRMMNMKAFDPLVKTGYEYANQLLQDERKMNQITTVRAQAVEAG